MVNLEGEKMLKTLRKIREFFDFSGFVYKIDADNIHLEIKDETLQYSALIAIAFHGKKGQRWDEHYFTDKATKLILKVKAHDNEHWKTEIDKESVRLHYIPENEKFQTVRWIIMYFNDHLRFAIEDEKTDFERLQE